MKAIAIVGLAAIVSSPLAVQEGIEQSVDAIVQKWADGWNRGDAAACVALHTEDGDRVGFDGSLWKGRAAMQESLAAAIDAYKGSSLELVRTALDSVSPDIVVTDGTWEIRGGAVEEGRPTKGFYTFFMTRQGDTWQIVSLRVKVPPT
jgi:uncharacterized protein (TIGR02246 family)